MELEQLKQVLYTTDPATVLVAPRVLRRLLQAEYKVPHLLVQAPHERCYYFDREVLFRHVEQDELEVDSDRLLPETVIVLMRPTAEQLESMDNAAILSKYWRWLFHVHVHLALEQRRREGQLTLAAVRARIEQIGQTEFEEIRTVLQEEKDLLPPADDVNTYIEFAAVYLELRYFRSNLRGSYFPAIGDFQIIDQLLAQDIDADAIFAKTRLEGAPDPVIRTDTSSDESNDYYWKLLRHAERARAEGDNVRAGILHTKAARVAPVAQMAPTRAAAIKDMECLTENMQDAMKFSTEDGQEWLRVLPALLDKSDQGNWPVEAKLLYDLQEVCMEHQRKTYALDLVEWAISAGKRPIKRPLTSLQLVRTTKHLRTAAQRLTMARVSDDDRQRLVKLLQAALQYSEERLRERFRPVLRDALHDVGLVPASPPEQVAFQKIVEELLDRITEFGFFTFSDLRDTLSRNQLKLPDLSDPHSYWRGDPLLLLDRRLAALMEGVYRHGEFYLRWMESVSSLFFGTTVGRFVTRNIVLPFGGAFALIKTLEILLGLIWPAYFFLQLGIGILLLQHFDNVRELFGEGVRWAWRALRFLLYDGPVWLWERRWLQQFLQSWPSLLLYWYVLKPLAVSAAIWMYWPATFSSWLGVLVTFVLMAVILNSRFGYALSEAIVEAVVLLYGWLRFDLLQGIVRWVSNFFKRVTRTVESILYTVDEWLRFRSDESRLTMVLRAVLGVLWFPVGYLIRLYFVTLIEPSINPLKLPIASLAFKFMLLIPLYRHALAPTSYLSSEHSLTAYLGQPVAVVSTFAFIIPTLYLVPSACAFFFWEMKENWRLFRANRPRRLAPVAVGRHGETILQLLKPGFHSGTIPRLFSNLRHAERSAYLTGDWRPARTNRQALQEVAKAVQLFIEREFIALLRQSQSWPNQPVRVAQIILSCNRIRIELGHGAYPQEPLSLAFEEHAGWLVGSAGEQGWLKYLTREQRQVLTSALAGLYKIAGVDFVREQVNAILPPQVPGYDLTDHQLVVWTGERNSHEIAYDLRDRRALLRPRQLNGQPVDHLPLLDAQRLVFSQVPLTWEQWVDCWQKDHEGKGHPRLFGDGIPPLVQESRPQA